MAMSGPDGDTERTCPYKGLFPFNAEDEKYFFGRTGDAELIAANILSAPLLILHGPSGVGKSSMLGAELPRSLDRILPDPLVMEFRRWDCGFYGALLHDAKRQGWAAYRRYGARHRWSSDDDERELFIGLDEPEPAQLQPEMAEPVSIESNPMSVPTPDRRPRPRRSFAVPHAPRKAPCTQRAARRNSLERLAEIWAHGVGTPVVFVLDQFEQYFSGQDFGVTAEDHEFEADLARIIRRRDLGVHVLISIREDALYELNRMRARIPNILVRSLKLDYLDEEAAREAINGPLGVWEQEHGADSGPTRVSPDFVDELIRQVSRTGDGARIETPYLQLALTRLWEDGRDQGCRELKLDMLLRRGGASGIAKRHFDNTMAALSAEERRLCASIFDRMVTPSGMKVALSAADLARFAGEAPDRVHAVLDKLTHGPSRIIHRVISPTNEDLVLFEIFHDVLARPILDWVAAEQERVQQQARMREQQRLANEEKAKQEAKLREQQRFAEEKRKEARLYRWLTYGLACTAIVLLVLGLTVVNSYREAAQQKARVIAMRANTAIDNGQNRLGLLASLAAMPEGESLWQWLTRPITDEARRALARSLNGPLGKMLQGHGGRLSQVAFSPDGSLVATASEDASVRLWDAKTGKAKKGDSDREIDLRHSERVTSVAFSATGPFVATIAYDGSAHIWDAKTGREKTGWDGESDDNGHVVAISPDAETIITASFGGKQATIWSWHGHQGRPENAGSFQDASGFTHESGITSVSFDANGQRVLTTSWDKTARIWNLANRELVLDLPAKSEAFDGHDGPVRSAAFSPDGTLVVTASGKKARVWRTEPRCRMASCESDPEAPGRSALVRVLQGHAEQVMSANFDSSGKRVLTASLDGTVRIWDISTGDTLQVLQGPKVVRGNNASAAFRPDGRAVVTAFGDAWAYLWDVDAEAEPLPCMPGNVTSLAASREGSRIAASFDEAVRILDVSKPMASHDGRSSAEKTNITNSTCVALPDLDTTEQVMSLAFDGGASRLATAVSNRIDLWDIDRHGYRKLGSLEGHRGLVLSVAFDPTSQHLVTASQDGTARIWETASGASLILEGHDGKGAVFSAAFSSDGRRVATGSFDNKLLLWDAVTGRLASPVIDTEKPVLAVAFTSDDRYLLTTLLEEPTAMRPFRTSIAMWDARSGKRLSEQDANLLPIADHLVAYSQDAGILFSKGIVRLPANRDVIRSVVGSSGREGVYTVSLDGAVRMWRLPPSEPYHLIRYAREVVLAKLPQELRALSPEECRELGLSSPEPTGLIEAGIQHLWEKLGGATDACATRIEAP